MEFNIYFDNASIDDNTDATSLRTVQAFDHASFDAAFDALSAKFLCVVAYDKQGKLLRRYDNTRTMGVN